MKAINADAQAAFDAVKGQVTQLQGVTDYELVGYTEQVVAGLIYTITVKAGDKEFPVKIWKKLDGGYELKLD